MPELKIGLIGLDTSHVLGFAADFNDPENKEGIADARITVAFPGGSPDFPLSIDRMPGFTERLANEYGIRMLDSPRDVAEAVDAILLTTVDGRIHREQFAAIADLGKPTFIDKPFTTTSEDAVAIAELAKRHGTPVFTSSSLRYAAELQGAVADASAGPVFGAEFYGPMSLEPTQPGFFWYGIHSAEMLYTAMGRGCVNVRVVSTRDHDVAIGQWEDGRIGIVRGNRAGNHHFAGVIHREKGHQFIDGSAGVSPHQTLAREIDAFFRGAPPPVPIEESVELIRFLEAANRSRDTDGRIIAL